MRGKPPSQEILSRADARPLVTGVTHLFYRSKDRHSPAHPRPPFSMLLRQAPSIGGRPGSSLALHASLPRRGALACRANDASKQGIPIRPPRPAPGADQHPHADGSPSMGAAARALAKLPAALAAGAFMAVAFSAGQAHASLQRQQREVAHARGAARAAPLASMTALQTSATAALQTSASTATAALQTTASTATSALQTSATAALQTTASTATAVSTTATAKLATAYNEAAVLQQTYSLPAVVAYKAQQVRAAGSAAGVERSL